MKVILLEEVQKLGRPGDTVDVAAGYARNFLLPRKLAIQATEANLKALGHLLAQGRARQEQMRQEAEAVASRIASLAPAISKRAGEQGKLFGSVTKADVAEALKQHGIVVDRKRILLEEPIKAVGEYAIPIRLHPEVVIELKLSVAGV